MYIHADNHIITQTDTDGNRLTESLANELIDGDRRTDIYNIASLIILSCILKLPF